MYKKAIPTVFIFILGWLILPGRVSAQLLMPDPSQIVQAETTSRAFLVMNQETGEILLEKNTDEKWVPASLTKLVTALVVLDQNPDWNKACKFKSEHEVGGTRLNVKIGATYKLIDLLNASLVSSANNATVAMADCVMERSLFVQAMNDKAKALGAFNTHFEEPSGMEPKNTITAKDFSLIARAAFSTPKIQEITQKKTIRFSSISKPRKSHNLKTTDLILRNNSMNVIAGKTGYLDEALYNFATAVKVKGKYYVAIVLGSPTKLGSFEDAKKVVTAVAK